MKQVTNVFEMWGEMKGLKNLHEKLTSLGFSRSFHEHSQSWTYAIDNSTIFPDIATDIKWFNIDVKIKSSLTYTVEFGFVSYEINLFPKHSNSGSVISTSSHMVMGKDETVDVDQIINVAKKLLKSFQ